MISLLTAEQARGLDMRAANELNVPSRVLMENAGAHATEVILQQMRDKLTRVLIACGTGQNGGDGWVVARHLCAQGYLPTVWSLGDPAQSRDDALDNYRAAQALGLDARQGLGDLTQALGQSTLVVDALFGTGLSRPLEGLSLQAVQAINASKLPCVALDLPSGIHADTAQVCGDAIKAELTIAFAGHKRGLHQYPGVHYAGRVACVSIGMPSAMIQSDTMLMHHTALRSLLKPRPADAHKGHQGHILIVAGSPGKTGAALLTAHGAMRSGAGSVTIAPRATAFNAIETRVLECMTLELSADPEAAARKLVEFSAGADAAVLGPGIGLDLDTQTLALRIALELSVPTVLDADALSAFSNAGIGSLAQAAGPRVLTPHPGEAARLLGCQTRDIQADRYGAAVELAKQAKHVVVLKGARSIVASPDGKMCVCAHGCAAMATAGSGDVLAGVIAAQLKHTENSWEAASLGTLLHAVAGEQAARADRGLLAHEIADAIPSVVATALAL